METKLLAIYLNDHLAGATVGAAVAQRCAGSNRENDAYYSALSTVAEEIREDRASLLGIMSMLEIGTDPVKQALPRLRPQQLTELIARAERQLEEIEACRRRAAGDAFVGDTEGK